MRRYGFSKKKEQIDSHGAHTIRYFYPRRVARLLRLTSGIIYNVSPLLCKQKIRFHYEFRVIWLEKRGGLYNIESIKRKKTYGAHANEYFSSGRGRRLFLLVRGDGVIFFLRTQCRPFRALWLLRGVKRARRRHAGLHRGVLRDIMFPNAAGAFAVCAISVFFVGAFAFGLLFTLGGALSALAGRYGIPCIA